MGSISSITPLDGVERDIRAVGIPYGQCDSTSTSTAFTATVPGIKSLHDGVCALIKNGVVTSASGCTLNINGLGAKPIYASMSAATALTTVFNVNYTMLFVYDETRVSGGCWLAYYGYYTSSNTIGYQIRFQSATLPTLDKLYRYRMLFTSPDGKAWIPSNTSDSTSGTTRKTPNTRPFNPFGPIAVYATTTAVNAGVAPSAAYVWTQNIFVFGYAFNDTGAALNLDVHAPVYIVATPQSDGSAVLYGYTQTLPSSEDGKIYIFIGYAYDDTHVELLQDKPVFYHDSTGIRIWTGKAIPTKTSDLVNDSGVVALGGSTIASDGQILVYRASNSGWALGDLSGELGASNAAIYYIEHDDVNDRFKIDCNITSLLRASMSERNVLFVWDVSPETYMLSVKEIRFDSPTTIYSVTLQGMRYEGMEEVIFNFQPASSNPGDGLISTGPALWHKDDILTRTDAKAMAAVADSNGSFVITTEGGDFINFTDLMTAYISVRNLEIGYIDPNVGIYEAHIGRITYYNYSTMRIDILFYFPYSQQLITFVQTTIDGADALVSTSVYTTTHLPAVSTSDNGKELRVVNGTWDVSAPVSIPTKVSDLQNDSGFITGMEILSYGISTWSDFRAAYDAKKVVYCRASSNSNPATGSQTRLAFMAYVYPADNPSSVEFQYYRSVSSHTDAQQGDQVYVYKLESNGTWTVTVREAYTKIVAGTGLSSSYSNGVLTLNNTGGGSPVVTEVTVSTSGSVSQALDAGTIYHFTGALSALTVTAADPTVGTYQFDFISGSTVPTLTVPASWVMPDNFLVEPSARYSLTVENGYCSMKKWSNSHSPFIYLDSTNGDFTMNSSGLTSDSKVYANVGSEVVAVSIGGKLKSQLANNTWLKICDVSANAKTLIGSTYVESYISVGSGKVSQCAFNTWESASEIKFKNNTGAALAANTTIAGTLIIMRTL